MNTTNKPQCPKLRALFNAHDAVASDPERPRSQRINLLQRMGEHILDDHCEECAQDPRIAPLVEMAKDWLPPKRKDAP